MEEKGTKGTYNFGKYNSSSSASDPARINFDFNFDHVPDSESSLKKLMSKMFGIFKSSSKAPVDGTTTNNEEEECKDAPDTLTQAENILEGEEYDMPDVEEDSPEYLGENHAPDAKGELIDKILNDDAFLIEYLFKTKEIEIFIRKEQILSAVMDSGLLEGVEESKIEKILDSIQANIPADGLHFTRQEVIDLIRTILTQQLLDQLHL